MRRWTNFGSLLWRRWRGRNRAFPPRSWAKGERPTLARWLRERYPFQMDRIYLVNITGHFVVVRGRKFVDNKTMEPVFIRQAPGRRSRGPGLVEQRDRALSGARDQGERRGAGQGPLGRSVIRAVSAKTR